MQWNNKFSYPKSMRSMVNGSRMYAVNQEKLPSVTSILQATQSEEKKASLANWKARVGAAEANRIKNEASSSCLLYTSPSPRDGLLSRMPSSA